MKALDKALKKPHSYSVMSTFANIPHRPVAKSTSVKASAKTPRRRIQPAPHTVTTQRFDSGHSYASGVDKPLHVPSIQDSIARPTVPCKRLQAKLKISDVNDPLEREADRLADQAVAAAISAVPGDHTAHEHGPATVRGTPREHGEMLQRHSTGPETDIGALDTEDPGRMFQSTGASLPPHVEASLGSRLGYDFSRVRVHTDAGASLISERLGAVAFTRGHDIAFARGSYRPDTPSGLRLLSHELVHTAQQGASPRLMATAPPVTAAHGAPIQRRLLTKQERHDDSEELKQAKRHTGIVKWWLDQLPSGDDLTPGPLRRRWARWAQELAKANEPGFELSARQAAQLRKLLNEREPTVVKPPTQPQFYESFPEMNPVDLERVTEQRASFSLIKPEGREYREKLAEIAPFGESSLEPERTDGLSFEIVDGKLIATIYQRADIAAIKQLIDVMNEMAPDATDDVRKPFEASRVRQNPGVKTKFDTTPYLPSAARVFLATYSKFLLRTREFSALKGVPKEDKDTTLLKSTFQQFDRLKTEEEAKRRKPGEEEPSDQYLLERAKEELAKTSPTSPRGIHKQTNKLLKNWTANCHAFSALFFKSTYPKDLDDTLHDFRELRSTAPIPVAEVQVGDLVTFFSPHVKEPENVAKGGLLHSALVIRVSAPRMDGIEVLEKQNPSMEMSTRTVAQIHRLYTKQIGTPPEVRFYRRPRSEPVPAVDVPANR